MGSGSRITFIVVLRLKILPTIQRTEIPGTKCNERHSEETRG